MRMSMRMPLAQTREPKLLAEGEYPGAVPPNYIKTYDEGRPRSLLGTVGLASRRR
jgi:hypothetical protein